MPASTKPNLQTVDEESEDIQAVVDASEDMQLAIQELGLTGDLYMVIGVGVRFLNFAYHH